MSTQRPRVLLVDDETNVRTSIRRGLESLGYDVEVAVDGLEGVQSVEQGA